MCLYSLIWQLWFGWTRGKALHWIPASKESNNPTGEIQFLYRVKSTSNDQRRRWLWMWEERIKDKTDGIEDLSFIGMGMIFHGTTVPCTWESFIGASSPNDWTPSMMASLPVSTHLMLNIPPTINSPYTRGGANGVSLHSHTQTYLYI